MHVSELEKNSNRLGQQPRIFAGEAKATKNKLFVRSSPKNAVLVLLFVWSLAARNDLGVCPDCLGYPRPTARELCTSTCTRYAREKEG